MNGKPWLLHFCGDGDCGHRGWEHRHGPCSVPRCLCLQYVQPVQCTKKRKDPSFGPLGRVTNSKGVSSSL
jgi:hypothetical protein